MLENPGLLRITELADRDGLDAGARDGPALDLAHLTRQCSGDQGLEIELLLQFRTQSLRLAVELVEDVRLPPGAKADLAHRLRGSALAVGAGRVARAAAVVEACARAAPQGGSERSTPDVELSQAIGALRAAVADAAAEIDRLQG